MIKTIGEVPPIDTGFLNAQVLALKEECCKLERSKYRLETKVDRLKMQNTMADEVIRSYEDITKVYKEMLGIDEGE